MGRKSWARGSTDPSARLVGIVLSTLTVAGLLTATSVPPGSAQAQLQGPQSANACLGAGGEQIRQQQQYLQRLQRFADSRAVPGSPEHTAILRTGMGRLYWEGSACGSRNMGSLEGSENFGSMKWSVSHLDRIARGNMALLQMMQDGSAGMRVVGGQEVPEGWFPETVALVSNRGKDEYCTGLLLSEQAVLTAGHCVCDLGLDSPPIGDGDLTLAVRFGSNVVQGGGLPILSRAIDHTRTELFDPQFCLKRAQLKDLAIRGNDIAIVFLKEPISTQARLQNPANIRFVSHALFAIDEASLSAADIPPGARGRLAAPVRIAPPQLLHSSYTQLVVVGYGTNNDRKQKQPIGLKMAASVPVVSYICGWPLEQGLYRCAPGLESILIDTMGRDTCGGDSGGPAFLFFAPGLYYLIGITSRGVSQFGECGAGGIYTLMSPRIVQWLQWTAKIELRGYNDMPLR